MSKVHHPELAAGRWFTLTITEQLGNVGSEFERVLRWNQEKDAEHFQGAFSRMLELLDLTIADPRWQDHSRQRKLARLKEQIFQGLSDDESQETRQLRKYFFRVAVMSRKTR